MASRRLRGCGFLLASLILLLLMFPALDAMATPMLLIAVVASVFVAGVIVVHPGRRRVTRAVALAVIQIALTAVAVLNADSSFYLFTVGLGLATTAVLIVYSIYCVLRYVLEATHITHDQIYAGICVYLMLGFAFGCLYYLLNILQPGSFAVNVSKLGADVPDLMYFSFVTLATLGYGDTTPTAKTARALAELEAVAGTIYIAVFMARLVSLHSGPETPRGVVPDANPRKSEPTSRIV